MVTYICMHTCTRVGAAGIRCSECVPWRFNFRASCEIACDDLGSPHPPRALSGPAVSSEPPGLSCCAYTCSSGAGPVAPGRDAIYRLRRRAPVGRRPSGGDLR